MCIYIHRTVYFFLVCDVSLFPRLSHVRMMCACISPTTPSTRTARTLSVMRILAANGKYTRNVCCFHISNTLIILRIYCVFAAVFSSPRKLSTLNKLLESISCNTDKMWSDIEDVIVKTLISAHPILKHNYHTCFPNHSTGSACFEILGFDVLLDHRLRPWVLEVKDHDTSV